MGPLRHTLCTLAAALLFTGGAASGDELTESPDGPEHVKEYYTLDEALDEVFAKADTLWTERWTPDDAERSALESTLGWRLPTGEIVFHRGRRGDKEQGWAVVTEELGRFKPITFLVHVKPDGEVGKVLVMIYRESRGDGVRRQRFLKQYRGRTVEDPLRVNRDVTVLSGATISSRAVTAGVKRVLHLVRARYPDG